MRNAERSTNACMNMNMLLSNLPYEMKYLTETVFDLQQQTSFQLYAHAF